MKKYPDLARPLWPYFTEQAREQAVAAYPATRKTDLVDSRGWRQGGVMAPDYRKLKGYPRRQAVVYSPEEVRDVLNAVREGWGFEEIAEWHERNVNGICTLYRRCMELVINHRQKYRSSRGK